MKRIISLLLVLAMALSLVACGGTSAPAASADVAMQYKTAEEAKALLEDAGYVFFDIRKAADSSANSIPGAEAWDMDAAKEGDAEAGKATMTEATKDLDKQIILVCCSGKRYAQAATNTLSAIGYDMSKVWTLEGGFTNWSEVYPELTTAGPAAPAEIDALFEEGKATTDPAKRQEIYTRLQQLVADEALFYPLGTNLRLLVVSPELKGLEEAGLVSIVTFDDIDRLYF